MLFEIPKFDGVDCLVICEDNSYKLESDSINIDVLNIHECLLSF